MQVFPGESSLGWLDADPEPEELAAIEAELPEEQRRVVRRYWTRVVWEEVAKARPVEPTSWMSMSPPERAEIRPRRAQSAGGALRLVRGEGVDAVSAVDEKGAA